MLPIITRVAAQIGGLVGGTSYIIRKHFIPELFPILMISMIRLAGMAIVTEASLAFLGLGDPTSRSWGLIINNATSFKGIYFTEYWKWWLLYMVGPDAFSNFPLFNFNKCP